VVTFLLHCGGSRRILASHLEHSAVTQIKEAVSVFDHQSYRAYLTAELAARKAAGASYRQLASACGIGSPNYFQQVLSGARNLTVETAKKIAQGFELDRNEAEYFVRLVELETVSGPAADELLSKLKAIVQRAGRQEIRDDSIHSSWLHAVIWELAWIAGFKLVPEDVAQRLRGLASPADVRASLDFLINKGFLAPTATEHVYEQRPITFEPVNNVRRIERQQTHFRMLEIAKHKLSDDKSNREFQGLTVAAPAASMPQIKQRLRDFVVSLNDELSHRPDADSIIYIYLGAFKLIGD
jgi:uncharacterized protein (TIGR02147 family)